MEGGSEGQDRQVRRAGGLVVHRRGDLLGREVHVGAAALLAPFPHESGLVGGLVRVGAGHGGEDLVETPGSDAQCTGLEDVCPVVLGEVPQGGPVDDGASHVRGRCRREQGWVAVADGDGCDLGIDIQQDVTIGICDIVAITVPVIGQHIQTPGIEHLVELSDASLTFWSWYGSTYDWVLRLIGKEGLVYVGLQ